jgi:hypothetical protein
VAEDVPTIAPVNGNRNDAAPNIIWNGIEKGSAVEVLVHKGESGVAWFSAKVLDINNDSACISYDSHTEGECAFILFTCPHRCGDEHFFSTMQL